MVIMIILIKVIIQIVVLTREIEKDRNHEVRKEISGLWQLTLVQVVPVVISRDVVLGAQGVHPFLYKSIEGFGDSASLVTFKLLDCFLNFSTLPKIYKLISILAQSTRYCCSLTRL